MENVWYRSDYVKVSPRPSLVVAGLGGMGCEALSHANVSLDHTVAIDADKVDLERAKASKKVLVGTFETNGCGTNGHRLTAKAAMGNSSEVLTETIGVPRTFVLVTQLGGGMGSAAADFVSTLPCHSIVYATLPIHSTKETRADLDLLAEAADTTILVDQGMISKYIPHASIQQVQQFSNGVVSYNISALSRVLTNPEVLCMSTDRLHKLLSGKGISSVYAAHACGKDKAQKIVNDTLAHPLLDGGYMGAEGAVIYTECGSSVSKDEIDDVRFGLGGEVHPCYPVVSINRKNDDLGDEIRASVTYLGLRHVEKCENPLELVQTITV